MGILSSVLDTLHHILKYWNITWFPGSAYILLTSWNIADYLGQNWSIFNLNYFYRTYHSLSTLYNLYTSLPYWIIGYSRHLIKTGSRSNTLWDHPSTSTLFANIIYLLDEKWMNEWPKEAQISPDKDFKTWKIKDLLCLIQTYATFLISKIFNHFGSMFFIIAWIFTSL